jgi:hypothetical protein
MGTISAEFQILFHPDMQMSPKEVALVYTFDGKKFEDLYTNRIVDKNWNLVMYDIADGQKMEFFIRCVMKDGRLMIGRKEGKNYQIQLRPNTETGSYKAQVRLTDENMIYAGRRCLVCDQLIPKDQNICKTPQCFASYCPKCNRMLPPHANYCPWDKITFNG